MSIKKTVSLTGPDRVTHATLVYSQSIGNGLYMAGRSVVRRGMPLDTKAESAMLGVPSTRWGGGLTLDQAEKVLSDALANLITQGFVVTPPPVPSKPNKSLGMGY